MNKHESLTSTAEKIASRDAICSIYKKWTRNGHLPMSRQYITLSHDQTHENSEIKQLVKRKFIKDFQFVGIDQDENFVRKNQMKWNNATWHHGQWLDVLQEQRQNFNPGIIYFDSQHLYNHHIGLKESSATLAICKNFTGSLLAINLMLNNPQSKFKGVPEPETVINMLVDSFGVNQEFLEKTMDGKIKCEYFSYNGSLTYMGVSVFRLV